MTSEERAQNSILMSVTHQIRVVPDWLKISRGNKWWPSRNLGCFLRLALIDSSQSTQLKPKLVFVSSSLTNFRYGFVNCFLFWTSPLRFHFFFLGKRLALIQCTNNDILFRHFVFLELSKNLDSIITLTKGAHILFKPRRRIVGYGRFSRDVNGEKNLRTVANVFQTTATVFSVFNMDNEIFVTSHKVCWGVITGSKSLR